MCTVVLLLRPGHAWPLLLAANRDERLDRPWDPPGQWWPDAPGVVAGRDRSAGGTWMAMAGGLVAAVLNRPGSLGPAPGKRSRGALPLALVQFPTADQAAASLASEPAAEYRPFNAVVADRNSAWFARGLGHGAPELHRLAPGLHVVTAHDPDDPASPRGAALRPRFAAASPPDPGRGDWAAWQAILSDPTPPGRAMNVAPRDGFGTVCAALAGLPAVGSPVWLFAAGPPDRAPFRPVSLP